VKSWRNGIQRNPCSLTSDTVMSWRSCFMRRHNGDIWLQFAGRVGEALWRERSQWRDPCWRTKTA